MKKIFLFFLFNLACLMSYGQIFVSSNSYMYVGNQFVFSKQNTNLQNNGNIFLRRDGQFLQGTTASSTNTGLGKLSVYQEGTSDNFDYNYWCSPVGNASAAVGNENFGITMLFSPQDVINSNAAAITTGLNGSASPLTISNYWIWKYITSATYADWVWVGSSSNLAAGEGFTMKGTSGTDATSVDGVQNNAGGNGAQRYDFRGKPNDGNISVSVASGMTTLTGNPYPSAIDMQLFLADNLAVCDGNALYWEQDKSVNSHFIAAYRGGYGVYNGASNIYTPATFYTYDAAGNQGPLFSTPLNMYERKFAPIGQGFMVRGIANGNVTFRNTHRVFRKEGLANNSQFERNSNSSSMADYGYYEDIPNVAGIDYTQISKAPTPHIRINASLNNTAVRQFVLGFMDSAIDGLDKADALSPDNEADLPFDAYLVLNDEQYVLSTTSFNIDKTFPIGFKSSSAAIYRIQVADFINFDLAENVYLHDKETNVYYDIKNQETQIALPQGVNNTKYEITFKTNALGTVDNLKKDLLIFQDNKNQELQVLNPNSLNINSVALFDLAGKKIFKEAKLSLSDSYKFSTARLSQAVYLVEVTTDDGQKINQKILISNK